MTKLEAHKIKSIIRMVPTLERYNGKKSWFGFGKQPKKIFDDKFITYFESILDSMVDHEQAHTSSNSDGSEEHK